MAHYLIGDLQGCDSALQRLLNKIDFSPSRDTLFLLGDLVNRGEGSLAVLERLMAYGDAAHSLLGNHDLNLLAVAHGVRLPHRKDTIAEILNSPKRTELMHWLRQQRLAMLHHHNEAHHQEYPQDKPLLMVHAGILPSWTTTKTIAFAAEIETILKTASDAELCDFLRDMYGDTPTQWHDDLQGTDRLRVIVNVLTRLRFCTAQGAMEFASKDSVDDAPAGYMPWFDVPERATQDCIVAFGHWSTLGWLQRTDVYALDGGCVWGGCLNALKLGYNASQHQLVNVPCEQAQKPSIK